MRDLGTLGGNYSQAFGINNAGQVVGRRANTYSIRAVLWQPVQASDTTPPEIAYELVYTHPWPPNHKMQKVLRSSATDDSGKAPSLSVTVTSSEPSNTRGAGNTDQDWEIVDNGDGSFEVYVRAERSGRGNGRTYTVTITAEDAAGNTAQEIVEATVSHDRFRDKRLRKPRNGNW